MVDPTAQGERLQIAPVMKQLAGCWKFGSYGYVEMWVLEEQWKEEEEEEEERGRSEL